MNWRPAAILVQVIIMQLASSLEDSLRKSIQEAKAKGFEFLSSEFYVLRLLETDSGEQLLRNSGADTSLLRAQLERFSEDLRTDTENQSLRLLEQFLANLEPGKFLANNLAGLSAEAVKYFQAEDFTYAGLFRDGLKAMKPVVEQSIKIYQQTIPQSSGVASFCYSASLEKAILFTSFDSSTRRSSLDEKDLLLGLIAEGSSIPAWLLAEQGVRRIDLLNYESHKISKFDGHPALKPNFEVPAGILDQVFKKYDVIAYNDDYTPMDFVVWILQTEFGKSENDAKAIMMQIHEKGSALIGKYPLSFAQLKTRKAVTLAQDNSFPLLLKVAY